jgi:hypothetical protein
MRSNFMRTLAAVGVGALFVGSLLLMGQTNLRTYSTQEAVNSLALRGWTLAWSDTFSINTDSLGVVNSGRYSALIEMGSASRVAIVAKYQDAAGAGAVAAVPYAMFADTSSVSDADDRMGARAHAFNGTSDGALFATLYSNDAGAGMGGGIIFTTGRPDGVADFAAPYLGFQIYTSGVVTAGTMEAKVYVR